jgi:hypothetical protein
MKRKLSKVMLILGLLLAIFGLNQMSKYPNLVMTYYTKGVYLKIKYILGIIADKMPFAYGEVLVGILLIWGIGLVAYRLGELVKGIRMSDFKNINHTLLKDGYLVIISLLSVLIIFQGVWGLNYHQPKLLKQLSLESQAVEAEELIFLLNAEIIEMTHLRKSLLITSENVVTTDKNVQDLMAQSLADYNRASDLYDFIDKPSSPPKPIASSLLFSYSGVSGIYNPFTGEANVNQLNSIYMLPAVALHELAHQQGIAREDEANFLAYLIAITSESEFSQYSGRFMILIHGLNNLKKIDPGSHRAIYENLPLGIKNDLRAHSQLWNGYDSPLDELQDTMNDEYLKANGMVNGIGSYSEVINLYVAWAIKK